MGWMVWFTAGMVWANAGPKVAEIQAIHYVDEALAMADQITTKFTQQIGDKPVVHLRILEQFTKVLTKMIA